jgi:O-antigen/teichoic acid export membrane protein
MSFVLTAVVGRSFGPADTGLFFQTVAIFVILTNVFELGADTGLVRTLARQVALRQIRDLRRTVVIAVTPVVAAGLLVMVLIWSLAPTMSAWLGDEDVELRAELLRQLAPFVACGSLLAVVLGGIRGLGRVVSLTLIYNVALPLSRLLLVVIAVGAAFDIVGVIRVWVAPLPVMVIVAGLILGQLLARSTREQATAIPGPATSTPALARHFWEFSGSRGVAACVEIILDWVDVLVVAALRSPSEAGIYAVVTRCVRVGQLVEHAGRLAVGPRVGAALALDDHHQATALYILVARGMVLLAWPFYLTMIMFGDTVLGLFGAGFDAGAKALAIMSVVMMVAVTAGAIQTLLLMGGKSRWQMANKAAALCTSLGLNLVLVPLWGISGAALAWAGAVFVDLSLAIRQVRGHMRIALPVRALGLSMVLAMAAFGGGAAVVRLVWGDSLLALMVHLTCSGAAYLLACYTLRRHIAPHETRDFSRADLSIGRRQTGIPR